MTKTLNVVLFVPLLYAVFFLLYWIPIYQNELVAFDEYVLEKQVNYAADAAVEELLNTGNLDQDYHNLDKSDPTFEDIDTSAIINVEPDLAVEEFASMLCANFEMLPTEYNLNYVKHKYIKALLVCAYDGVYGYWSQPVADGIYDFVSTPKMPYFYTENEGTVSQKQYCINLGYTYGYSDSTDGGKYSLKKFNLINIPADVQKTAINNQVGELLNYALMESYKPTTFNKKYSIPALGSTIQGQQPISNITVLGVVEGQATSSASAITAECIGGARITTADRVIGYTFTEHKNSAGEFVPFEQKFYAKNSTWKALGESGHLASWKFDESSAVMFTDCFEAAKAGYYDLIVGLEGDW